VLQLGADGSYIYETSYGTYVMDGKEPYIMRFVSPTDDLLVDQSIWWVVVTDSLGMPLDLKATSQTSNVSLANNQTFRVSYLLFSKDTEVGNITVTWLFSKDQPPKIQVWFFRNETVWKEQGWVSFNVIWVIIPVDKYIKLDEQTGLAYDSSLQKEKLKTVYGEKGKEDKRIEIGPNTFVEMWSPPWLLVSWEDFYADVDLYYGKEDAWNKKGITLQFPTDVFFIDPTVVATSTDQYATAVSWQRRVWYDEKYDAWYVAYTDGTYYRYKFSTDGGQTWSSQYTCTTRDTGAAARWDTFFIDPLASDGKVHYVFGGNDYTSKPTDYPYYKQGTIGSDHIIAWGTEYNVAYDAIADFSMKYYSSVSTTGYPWWLGWEDNGGTRFYVRAAKSPTTDGSGTWTKYAIASSSGAGTGYAQPREPLELMQLQNGDMYATYTWDYISQRHAGKKFTASSGLWGSEEVIRNEDIIQASAVSNGTHVFIVMQDASDYNLYFYVRDPSTGWGSAQTAWTGLNGDGESFAISLHNATGKIYLFLLENGNNHIYYKIRSAAGEWGSPIDWYTESAGIANPQDLTISPFFNEGGTLGVVWTAKTSSPYNVTFAAFGAPTVYGIDASEDYAAPDEQFNLNMSIDHPQGPNLLINATMTLSDATVLLWINSTNSFSISSNPTASYTLVSASRTYVGPTAVRLSWRVSISSQHSLDVLSCTEAKTYDTNGNVVTEDEPDIFAFRTVASWLSNYEGYRQARFVKVTSGTGTGYVVKITVYKAGYRWKELTSSTYGRQYAEVVYHPVTDALYAIGGRSCASDPDAGQRYAYNEMYDPDLNSWTTKTAIPTAEDAGGAVAYGNYIYVAGGYPNGQKVYRYNVNTNAWDDTPTDLPGTRWDFGVALVGNYMYVLGGSNDANAYSQTWRLDLNNPTSDWEIKQSMTYTRAKLGSSVHNGKIYVFCSCWYNIHRKVERYDPSNNQWTTLTDMPDPASCTFTKFSMPDGYMYYLAGKFGEIYGDERSDYYGFGRYDPETDTYHKLENSYLGPPPRIYGMFYIANRTVGNDFYLYYFGGDGEAADGGGAYKQNLLWSYGPYTDSGEIRLSGVQNDFSDIVFTASDGQTVLDYAIERKIDGNWSTFAIKITGDLSANDQLIYMYYGDSTHSYSPDPSNTYLFYDDFSGGLSKWDLSSGSGGDIIEVSSGLLHIYQDAVAPVKTMTSKTAITESSIALEFDVKPAANTAGAWVMGIANASQSDSWAFGVHLVDADKHFDLYRRSAGAWTSLQIDKGVFEDASFRRSYRITKVGTSFSFYKHHPYDTIQIGSAQTVSLTGNLYVLLPRAWNENDATTAGDSYWDNIRVRKYVSPEPSFYVWDSEETYTPSGSSPTVDSFEVTFNYQVANDWFHLYVQISDLDGATTLLNFTLNLGKGIELLWTTAGFSEKADPYSLCSLHTDISSSRTVDSDTLELDFIITIDPGYGEEWKNVSGIVYDEDGNSGSGSQSSLFYFYLPATDGGSTSGIEQPQEQPQPEENQTMEETQPLPSIDFSSPAAFSSSLREVVGTGMENFKIIARPWIQQFGPQIIIFLLLMAWLIHELNKERKKDEKVMQIDWRKAMGDIELDRSHLSVSIPSSKRKRKFLKWALILTVIAFLLFFTPLGRVLKEEIELLLGGIR